MGESERSYDPLEAPQSLSNISLRQAETKHHLLRNTEPRVDSLLVTGQAHEDKHAFAFGSKNRHF